MTDKAMLTPRMSHELHDRVKAAAKLRGISANEFVCQVLDEASRVELMKAEVAALWHKQEREMEPAGKAV